MSHAKTKETIVRLLSSMADGKEIRQYLKYYADPAHKRLAVIKVGGAILQSNLDDLASALSFLHGVGLIPIVIHGAGPQIDAAMTAANIPTEKKNGLRVTRSDSLKVIRDTFIETNIKLMGALEALDVPTTSVTAGVFEATYLNEAELGHVGEITKVNLAPIEAILQMNKIPLLMPMGETKDGHILNVNADSAANKLITSLQPHKIVFLTETGGILDGDGKIISSVNLSMDYEELIEQDWLSGGMRLKFEEIADLLNKLPLSSSVSMTSPAELAKELFTHTGSGTLIRKGEMINQIEDKNALPKDTVIQLIQNSFGRTLKKDFLQSIELKCAFLSQEGRALALVSTLHSAKGDIPFLDKFAVSSAARGEGLAKSVWREMVYYYPQLIWRSRIENPINAFYLAECDGHMRQGKWLVLWRGIEDFDLLKAGIEATVARPESFEAAE